MVLDTGSPLKMHTQPKFRFFFGEFPGIFVGENLGKFDEKLCKHQTQVFVWQNTPGPKIHCRFLPPRVKVAGIDSNSNHGDDGWFVKMDDITDDLLIWRRFFFLVDAPPSISFKRVYLDMFSYL